MCVAGGGVCWHLGIGARDAANHPTVHRTEKELSDPKVKSAEAEQLSPLVTGGSRPLYQRPVYSQVQKLLPQVYNTLVFPVPFL